MLIALTGLFEVEVFRAVLGLMDEYYTIPASFRPYLRAMLSNSPVFERLYPANE
jgi:hypothetical protein